MADRFDEQLVLGYIEGDLSPSQEKEFQATLAGDPRLRDLVEQLTRDRASIREWPDEAPPRQLMDRVIPQLERYMLLDAAADACASEPASRWRLGRVLAGGGIAAMLLLSIVFIARTLIDDTRPNRYAATPSTTNELRQSDDAWLAFRDKAQQGLGDEVSLAEGSPKKHETKSNDEMGRLSSDRVKDFSGEALALLESEEMLSMNQPTPTGKVTSASKVTREDGSVSPPASAAPLAMAGSTQGGAVVADSSVDDGLSPVIELRSRVVDLRPDESVAMTRTPRPLGDRVAAVGSEGVDGSRVVGDDPSQSDDDRYQSKSRRGQPLIWPGSLMSFESPALAVLARPIEARSVAGDASLARHGAQIMVVTESVPASRNQLFAWAIQNGCSAPRSAGWAVAVKGDATEQLSVMDTGFHGKLRPIEQVSMQIPISQLPSLMAMLNHASVQQSATVARWLRPASAGVGREAFEKRQRRISDQAQTLSAAQEAKPSADADRQGESTGGLSGGLSNSTRLRWPDHDPRPDVVQVDIQLYQRESSLAPRRD